MTKIQAKGKALLNRIKGVTSDALSFPARTYYGEKGRRADQTRATLKRGREWDNAPSLDEKGQPTQAFKDRSAANSIRKRYGVKPLKY